MAMQCNSKNNPSHLLHGSMPMYVLHWMQPDHQCYMLPTNPLSFPCQQLAQGLVLLPPAALALLVAETGLAAAHAEGQLPGQLPTVAAFPLQHQLAALVGRQRLAHSIVHVGPRLLDIKGCWRCEGDEEHPIHAHPLVRAVHQPKDAQEVLGGARGDLEVVQGVFGVLRRALVGLAGHGPVGGAFAYLQPGPSHPLSFEASASFIPSCGIRQ